MSGGSSRDRHALIAIPEARFKADLRSHHAGRVARQARKCGTAHVTSQYSRGGTAGLRNVHDTQIQGCACFDMGGFQHCTTLAFPIMQPVSAPPLSGRQIPWNEPPTCHALIVTKHCHAGTMATEGLRQPARTTECLSPVAASNHSQLVHGDCLRWPPLVGNAGVSLPQMGFQPTHPSAAGVSGFQPLVSA